MNFKRILLFSLASGVLLAACASAKKEAGLLPGADRDAHGCIGSAGYVWSEVQGRCLRMWEDGIQLTDVQNPRSSFAGYVILSKDGTQSEVFLPGQETAALLKRSFTPDGPRWMSADGTHLLERLPQGWRLFEKGRLIYTAANPADASK